jgi:hypothetical protein
VKNLKIIILIFVVAIGIAGNTNSATLPATTAESYVKNFELIFLQSQNLRKQRNLAGMEARVVVPLWVKRQ